MQQNNSTYRFYGPEDIQRYLSGSMSAQEMHDMEKAALKDPLLADAIDGFRGADPIVSDMHLNAIKASILGLSQQEKREIIPLNPPAKTQWWRWAAAACSLTLIAGGTWWITEKTDPTDKPLANTEQIQTLDTTRIAKTPPSANVVKETTEPDDATATQEIEQANTGAISKKEPIASTKVAATAPAEVAQAPFSQQIVEDETILARKDAVPSELKTFKKEQVINGNWGRVTGASPTASATPFAKNINTQTPARVTGLQPVAYIEGLVVDEEGAPLPNATVSLPGNSKTMANNDGSFVLPAYDSSFNVSVNMVGYQNTTAFLKPGTQNKIVLEKAFNNLHEMVVVGNASNRKKTAAFTHMQDARKAQADAVSANEIIYPEEGWGHFYEELGTSLGVDKAKKTKTLQIKFTVDDNGDPVDFEVVESPDAIMAKKAIEFIKKAKWKNFKLDKNALVKIEVN